MRELIKLWNEFNRWGNATDVNWTRDGSKSFADFMEWIQENYETDSEDYLNKIFKD